MDLRNKYCTFPDFKYMEQIKHIFQSAFSRGYFYY